MCVGLRARALGFQGSGLGFLIGAEVCGVGVKGLGCVLPMASSCSAVTCASAGAVDTRKKKN